MKIISRLVLVPFLFFLIACGGSSDQDALLSPPQDLVIERVDGGLNVTWAYSGESDKARFDMCYAREIIKNVADCTRYNAGKLLRNVQSSTKVTGLETGAERHYNSDIDAYYSDATYYFVVVAASDDQSVASKNKAKIFRNYQPIPVITTSYGEVPVSKAPAWMSGPVFEEGKELTVDASASYDPDGDAINFDWTPFAESGSFAMRLIGDSDTSPIVRHALPSRQDVDLSAVDTNRAELAVEHTWHLVITDSNNTSSELHGAIINYPLPNTAPDIQLFTSSHTTAKTGEAIILTIASSDPEGDKVSHHISDSAIDNHEVALPFEKINESTFSVTAPKLGDEATFSFVLTAKDHFGAKSSETMSVKILPPENFDHTTLAQRLNDTGMTKCADSASVLGESGTPGPLVSCTELIDADGDPVPQGQDGHIGRDVTHNDPGDGHAGFSFTKLSENGAALPATTEAWSCVRDNTTGLIWEAKTDKAETLHYRHNPGYFWYEPDFSMNKGQPGVRGDSPSVIRWSADSGWTKEGVGSCFGYDESDQITWCDTYHFAQRVNQEKLCGYDDWRVPGIEELHSIANYSPEKADYAVFFPHLVFPDDSVKPPAAYWSSTASRIYESLEVHGQGRQYPTGWLYNYDTNQMAERSYYRRATDVWILFNNKAAVMLVR